MNSKKKINGSIILEFVILILIISVTYLPNLSRATIYRDDWYYTMDRLLGGPSAFHTMFAMDRPARGYFFEVYYLLFGVDPAPFHAVSFAWRLAMGLAALWLFHQLWPKRRFVALSMALLYTIYPGYTRWMEGYENQPKVASLFLMAFSFALTLQAIKISRTIPKIIFWLGSIVSGWGYILLVDYAMGMEAFRFLCVFAMINRQMEGAPVLRKAVAMLKRGFPGLLVLGVFLIWRLLIFQNQRAETDIGLQLSSLIGSPLETGSWWIVHLLQSFANTTILAFGAPAFQEVFGMGLSKAVQGLLLAAAAGGCLLAGAYWLRKTGDEPTEPPSESIPWQREAVLLGLAGVTAGVLPVVMANRTVTFGPYSHYALPASLAAAILIVGLVGSLTIRQVRLSMMTTLVMLAVLNQYSASSKVLKEEQVISQFWHQVVWRAPGIREATGLVVSYPSLNYGEDVDAVNGPANFIYFPTPTNQLPVRYPLEAVKQYPWTAKEFLAGGKNTLAYRTHYGVIDYGYLLVMSQPTEDACVHIIDRESAWFNYNDSDATIIIGQNSNLRNILTEASPPKLRETIFGPEPAHGWCYTFEKAELALQMKDYRQVAALGSQAASQGLQPADPIEWMPFLQAYARLDDSDGFARTAEKIDVTEFNRVQACNVLTQMQINDAAFSAQIQEQINELICR